MELKVGDVVRYRGQNVRVVKMDNESIQLPEFGWRRPTDPGLELVESVKLPQLNDGDFVIVHDIPKSEKNSYGTDWMDIMDQYVGQIVQVHNPKKSQYSGDVAFINSWLFQTYHLEPVSNYDMI